MTMPRPLDFAKEMALSLQHVRRIRKVLPLTPSPDDPPLHLGLVIWTTIPESLSSVAAAVLKALELGGVRGTSDSKGSRVYPPLLFVVPAALPKAATVEVQAIFQTLHQFNDEYAQVEASFSVRAAIGLREESAKITNGRSFTIFWFNWDSEYLQRGKILLPYNPSIWRYT